MFPRWGMGDAPSRVLALGGRGARLLARARVPFPPKPRGVSGLKQNCVYFSAPRTKRPMPYASRTRAHQGTDAALSIRHRRGGMPGRPEVARVGAHHGTSQRGGAARQRTPLGAQSPPLVPR